MRIKLSYIGINTDNPTPIILTDSDVAIIATKESLQHAIVEVDKFKHALNEAYLSLFGSTLDQDEIERARKQVNLQHKA